MKLNSKSGATLAPPPPRCSCRRRRHRPDRRPADAAQGKCMAANACKGQSACKSAGEFLQGPERLQGQRLPMASGSSARPWAAKFVKG